MRQQWEQRRGEPVTFFSNTSIHPLSPLHPERLFLESKCQMSKRQKVRCRRVFTNISTEAHVPTTWYGHYLMHAHIHITPAVAVMDSCFALMGAHQHGILIRSMSRRIHVSKRVVQYSQIDSIGVSGDKKGLHWYQCHSSGSTGEYASH